MKFLKAISVTLCLCLSVTWAAPAVSEDATTDESLSTMLNILKGDSVMETMSNYLKLFKIGSVVIKDLNNVSPMYHQVLATAAKNNPMLDIVLKAVNHEFPSIKDLADLVTSRKKSIGDMKLLSSDANAERFRALSQDRTTFRSPRKLTQWIRLVTGKTIVIDPNMLAQMNAGTFVVTPENLDMSNLLNAFKFYYVNQNVLNRTSNAVTSASSSADIVRAISRFFVVVDVTPLLNIKTVEHKMDNEKYGVAQKNAPLVTDPRITQCLKIRQQDIQMAKAKTLNVGKLESDILQIITGGFQHFTEMMNKVEASQSRPSKQQQQPALG